ncbi:MAG: TolC family protein [Candidatus Competibacteraceae bacterium]|nr:TolC family protein [Candidatus Competibacteraceae bacterium]
MKGNQVWALIMLCVIGIQHNYSQNTSTFSLQQSIDYALQNNVNALNAQKDIEKSRHIVNENIGLGLPQISGNAQYNYNIESPVFVFPNVMGPNPNPNEFIAINAAPLNNLSMSAVASMLIVNGQYFFGIQAAKTYLEMTRNQKTKTSIEIKEQIIKSYYLVLIAEESSRVLDSSLKIINKTVYETGELWKEGLIEELDYEQMQLMQLSTQNAYDQVMQSRELALLSLKFQMGYPLGNPIQLSDNLDGLLTSSQFEGLAFSLSDSIDVRSNIDYTLISQKLKLNKQQYKLQMSTFFPSLSTFLQVGGNFFNNERWLFLGDGTTSTLNGVIWGLNLQVPVFSSWSRMSKLKQAKVEIHKTQNQQRYVEQGLVLQYRNSKTQVIDNYKRYLTSKKSYELAEKIRRVNTIKYREGLISSLNLSQAEQQYFEHQQKYFQAIFDLLNAKIQLDKSMNKF